MTGKQSVEFPNMAQRGVMQYLRLDDWKVSARLPIPAGELMLSRIRNYGWIEIQGEKHQSLKNRFGNPVSIAKTNNLFYICSG